MIRLVSNLSYFLEGALVGGLSFAPFCLFPIFLVVFSCFLAEVYENCTSFGDIFRFFIGFYVSNLYWIVYPLTLDLAAHYWLIPFAIVIIPGCLSLFMFPVFWTLKCIKSIGGKILLFPILYTAMLAVQGSIFPWVLPAYIWNSHEVFMQTLSVYGVYGLSFVTMLMVSLLAAAIFFRRDQRKRSVANSLLLAAASASIFFGICIFGIVRLATNPTKYTDIKVHMVQLNATDAEKKANKMRTLQRLIGLSYVEGSRDGSGSSDLDQQNQVDLIIWPEATIPYLYNEQLIGLHQMISRPLGSHSYLIAGAVREGFGGNIYNSAVFVDSSGANRRNYDKMHLVPFGEYIPCRFLIPETLESIASEVGDFSRGSPDINDELIELWGDSEARIRIGVIICYEGVFQKDCLKYDVKKVIKERNKLAERESGEKGRGRESAIDVLINLTNDGWFGFTSQPFQHLQIVRARAIELGIPMIRVANIGISAVFDPMGREITRIPLGSAGTADFRIPQKLKNETLFKKLFLKFILPIISVFY